MVKHLIPKNLEEAVLALSQDYYQIIAGGTDLMIQKRNDADLLPVFQTNMLYAFNLDELKYVNKEQDQIKIGSMTSLETLLHHPDVPDLLKEVIIEVASPGIRNMATLAGNIANASPAGDTLVALYLMDAIIVLKSKDQERSIPIGKVILGPRKTSILQNELIKEIIIPIHNFTKTSWVKVGGRRADAISKVSFAGAITIDQGEVIDFRIALGAVYKTVVRSLEIENLYKNIDIQMLKNNLIHMLNQYQALIKPIDDQRSNKIYRNRVALNLIEDFVRKI
jgi:xanthine dehydrogenase FAD-binding subunit